MAGEERMTEDRVAAFVAEAFACPGPVAAEILAHARRRAYPPQALIVRQDERPASAWLILLGRAHALLCTLEGQLILLHQFGPGDLFGALAGADPVQERADIVAADAVDALQMDGRDLILLAERHGSIGLALSRLLLRRLRQATDRMYARAALSAVGRVHAELLRQARQDAGLAIRPPPVIAELALAVATTRETASRAIGALERRGIIRRDADALVVVAPQRLEELIL